MVDKDKFGERRVCACGCKFYDMHRVPPVCPKCKKDVTNQPQAGNDIGFEPEVEDEEEEEMVDLPDDKTPEVDPDGDVQRDDEDAEEF